MIKLKLTLIVIFAIYFTLMGLWGHGCSSGKNNPDPIRPDIESQSNPALKYNPISSIPIAFADNLPDGGTTGIGVLGIFDVTIDPKNLNSDITSLRNNTAIGDSFIVDITNFLTISPCVDCLSIGSMELDPDGNLVVLFMIRHPFQHGTLDKPPSAANRLDLHIFDVFGVMHFPGTLISFPILQNTVGPVRLVNADGYTGQFDSQIDPILPTEASIHPYVVMSFDASEGNFNPDNPCGFEPINNPTGHNVLKMGGTLASYFKIDFSDSDPVNFLMVITAAYGQSATIPTRLTPKYYMPEFNRKEAWKVRVKIDVNNLFEGNTSSYCDLGIDVWDWNHGVTVDPALTTKDVIRASSDVQSVEIEMPGVLLTPVTATGPISGDGRTAPLRYIGRIYYETGGSSGIRWGLVKVKDSRAPGSNTGGFGDGVNRDGRTFFQLTEFATYQLFNVEIHKAEPYCIIAINPDPPIIYPSETVSLDGSSSYDYDGSIISYEWDYDYNGSIFNVDATGVIPIPPPPSFDNNHNINNKTVTIALRVTDDNLPVPYSTVCNADVTVLPNRQPTAILTASIDPPVIKKGGSIDFDATGSFDLDGDTITYEWDWNYENYQFTADDTGPIISHQFLDSSCAYIALRVSDQGIPSPRTDIQTMQVWILPMFSPLREIEIDSTMLNRSGSHNAYSCMVATDPNTNDIYVAYDGLTSGTYHYVRVQRSNDGGITWSVPYPTQDPTMNAGSNNMAYRGIALVVVPDNIPGTVYAFWISDGSNSTAQQYDGWNIQFNQGIPSATSNTMAWNISWHQDITLYSLSDGSGWNAPYEYCYNYYYYSKPLHLAAVADPITAGAVYVAFSETSFNSNCGESVRLIKTTDIQNYPISTWAPLTQTAHVESSGGYVDVSDFTGVDLAIDSSHNVYVVWDNNMSGAIKIRKYPFGLAPGNSIQVIDSDPVNTHLSNPRIATGKDNVPVVVYNDTFFPGGVDGVTDIILSYGTDDAPTMSSPMLVNNASSRATNKQNPDIVTKKECGLTFVAYEDYRDNPAQRNIYWTILNEDFEIVQTDERANRLDPTSALDDFDVHIGINQPFLGGEIGLFATWEQVGEDTWVSVAN